MWKVVKRATPSTWNSREKHFIKFKNVYLYKKIHIYTRESKPTSLLKISKSLFCHYIIALRAYTHIMILIQLDKMVGKYGLLRAEEFKSRFSPFPSFLVDFNTLDALTRAIISTIQPCTRPTRVFLAWRD